MTIASQTSRISYVGDGVTVSYAAPFYFAANADLVVILQDTLGNQVIQVLGTNYNLTGATLSAGGTCTFVTAPTTGYLVTIYRDPAVTQATSYNNNDPFPAKSHELALDKLTTIAQRLKDQISRTLHQTEGEPTMVTALATIALRKNRLLGFDTNGVPTYVIGPTFVGTTYIGVADVDSRVTAAITVFPIAINVVRTHGFTTPGDGGGADYIRGIVSSPGAFQDAGGVYWKLAASKFERTVTAAGAVTAASNDDIIIIKKTVGAATTVNVDWSARTKPLTIVDGKADANTNPITIVPSAGQTQYGTADYQVIIDGNGGSVTLTPLSSGAGAF